MVDSQNIPWKRLAIEAPAIVLSILLAFAIDAWWEERQTEQDIVEDLAVVEHELRENIRLVYITIDTMERIVAAKDRMVANLRANAQSESVEVSAADVYWAIFINPTLDPSLGGTDAWIGAGQLGVLESLELRQRLAAVRGKFEDTIEEQRDARDISILQIYPAIQSGSDITVIKDMFAAGFHARQATEVQEIPDFGTMTLPSSDALIFSLQTRGLWYEASIVESRDLLTELEEIHVLVQAEMAHKGAALDR
jgi:hypothetical protein